MNGAHLAALLNQWGLSTAALRFVADKKPQWIIGADEVGYGALAGPYAVGAFVCPVEWTRAGVKDSKKFKDRAAREKVYSQLLTEAGTGFCVHMASNKRIDSEGKLPVLNGLFEKAVMEIVTKMCFELDSALVILDGQVKIPYPHFSIEGADAKIPAVSAASIMAKVERDWWMERQDEEWPVYGFKSHSGYGTSAHIEALKEFGPCEIHRRSYEPIASMVRKEHANLPRGEDRQR